MLKLSLKVFRSFIKENTSSFLMMSVGIFVILSGVTFVISRGAMLYKEEADFNCETRKVTIVANDPIVGNDAKELLAFLLENDNIPAVQRAMTVDYTNDIIGHFCSGEAYMAIPYGRYFSGEESEGENVVLLSEAYLNKADTSLLINMLDNWIQLGNINKNYKIIGRYNSTLICDTDFSHEVVIPLKTYVYNGFPISNLDIIFTERPSECHQLYMRKFLEEHNISYEMKQPSRIEKKAIWLFLQETGSHFIILLICYITLLNLLKYWIKENYRRFYIYYVCGCASGRIRTLLLLNTFYMYILPNVLSIVCYTLIGPYFSTVKFIVTLPFAYCSLIYFATLGITLLITWVIAIGQLKKFNEIKEIVF